MSTEDTSRSGTRGFQNFPFPTPDENLKRTGEQWHQPRRHAWQTAAGRTPGDAGPQACGLPGSGDGNPCIGGTAHSGGMCYTPHTWTASSALSDAARTGPPASGTSLCLHKTPALKSKRRQSKHSSSCPLTLKPTETLCQDFVRPPLTCLGHQVTQVLRNDRVSVG